jgi:Protein of unknown function (DUF1778)
MGRPPKGGGGKLLGGRLEIRVEEAEKSAYDQAAALEGIERSDWIRATLNAAATRILCRKREKSRHSIAGAGSACRTKKGQKQARRAHKRNLSRHSAR